MNDALIYALAFAILSENGANPTQANIAKKVGELKELPTAQLSAELKRFKLLPADDGATANSGAVKKLKLVSLRANPQSPDHAILNSSYFSNLTTLADFGITKRVVNLNAGAIEIEYRLSETEYSGARKTDLPLIDVLSVNFLDPRVKALVESRMIDNDLEQIEKIAQARAEGRNPKDKILVTVSVPDSAQAKMQD